MATVTDPYNVPLEIFRNREWVQPFSVLVAGAPVDVSRDSLALIVLQDSTVVLTNKTPTVGSGSGNCVFPASIKPASLARFRRVKKNERF